MVVRGDARPRLDFGVANRASADVADTVWMAPAKAQDNP